MLYGTYSYEILWFFCNSLYAKSRAVELMKSYCMPFILYATEALPLSNRITSMLDNCVSKATAKFFSWNTQSCRSKDIL